MGTLYLHIGTPKTGTTAIQSFCEANPDALMRQGVCFPIFRERFGRVKISRNAHFMLVPEDMPDGSRRSPEETERWRRYMDQVETLLRKHAVVLLSDEGIWEYFRFDFPNILPALKREAEARGFDLKIFVYLRRQDQYLVSFWTQKIKNANMGWSKLKWKDALARAIDEHILDYYGALEYIAAQVGRDSIDVRVYERQRFPKGDIVLDFLNALGLRTDIEYRRTARDVNTSISPGMRDIKRTLNILMLKPRPAGWRIIDGLYKCSQFDPSRGTQPFTEEERSQLLELCEESNRRVARDYLGDESKPLFSPPEKLGEQHILSEHERWENTVRFFGELILVQQRQIEELKSKLYLRRKLRYAGSKLREGLAKLLRRG